MSILTDTAPKRIYLCVSDDADDYAWPYPETYWDDEAITWSIDSPVACTVEYVRADLHAALNKLCYEYSAELEILRALRAEWMKGKTGDSFAWIDVAEVRRERDVAIAAQAKAEHERDNAWDTCKRALHKVDDLTARAEKAEKDRDAAEVERDDAIRTAQDNAGKEVFCPRCGGVFMLCKDHQGDK